MRRRVHSSHLETHISAGEHLSNKELGSVIILRHIKLPVIEGIITLPLKNINLLKTTESRNERDIMILLFEIIEVVL